MPPQRAPQDKPPQAANENNPPVLRKEDIEALREEETSKNIINESLAITKELEAQKAGEDAKIAEVESALKAYSEKRREGASDKAPEPMLRPEEIRAPAPNTTEGIKEMLKHSLVGDAWAGLQRVGIGIGSAPMMATLESFYQWRHGRTLIKEEKLKTIKEQVGKQVTTQAEKKATLEARIEEYKQKGEYTPKTRVLFEREIDAFDKEIERLKIKEDTAHARWEKSSNKDAFWRNRQKQVAERVVSTVEEKKRPYVHKLEEQRAEHTALEAKLKEQRVTKEKWVSELSTLEKKAWDKSLTDAQRARLAPQIDQIKEALTEHDRAYNAGLAQSRRVSMKMNATNRRISRWQGMSNEFTRAGNRSHAPGEHEGAKEELGGHARLQL